MFVCVDDYLRFSWVSFLREKFETFNAFKILYLNLMREKNKQLKKTIGIRCDHEKEFENSLFTKFCSKHGINHEFSTLMASQHNGMEEGKKKSLREMARVMLKEKKMFL